MLKTTRFFPIILFLFLYSCQSAQIDMQKQIAELEATLLDEERTYIDSQTASQLITVYIDFAKEFPTDAQSPFYLYKAGELSMNINQGSQAIQYFEQLRKQYSEFEKMPEVIFMEAFIYESLLKNEDKAREYYTLFIDRYPNHNLYKDAVATRDNLGKSLDDIIREFEKKNASSPE